MWKPKEVIDLLRGYADGVDPEYADFYDELLLVIGGTQERMLRSLTDHLFKLQNRVFDGLQLQVSKRSGSRSFYLSESSTIQSIQSIRKNGESGESGDDFPIAVREDPQQYSIECDDAKTLLAEPHQPHQPHQNALASEGIEDDTEDI